MSNSMKNQDDPMPIAEDWLTEEQIAQVNARVRAQVCLPGVSLKLKTQSDIFTTFPQLLSSDKDA